MARLSFLFAFTLISQMLFAQSVKEQEVIFKYIQYPTKNLGAKVKDHSSVAYLKYEEDIANAKAQEKAEFDKLVAEDEARFEQQMAEYPNILAAYEAQYAEQMREYEVLKKEYDEKSAGLKVVEKQLLEKDTEPRKPYYRAPSKPVLYKRYFQEREYQKVFDAEMLTNSYLNLEGFRQLDASDLKIEVTLFGYEEEEPKLNTEKGSEYQSLGKNKGGRTVTVYYYTLSHKYRHPINLKITHQGKVLMDEILPEIAEWTTYSTYKSKERPYFNPKSMTEEAQNAIVEKNMKIIQDYINDNYGYPVKDRRTNIYYIKDKKVDYSDYQTAFETIYAAYNQYFDENGAALAKINDAIAIWEKALKESDPDNRKARVDNDVTFATLISLSEAHTWVGNYVEAEGYLNKTVSLKTSKKEEELVASMREFIKDQKIRAQALN